VLVIALGTRSSSRRCPWRFWSWHLPARLSGSISQSSHEISGGHFAMVGVLYAVVLAFGVRAVWERFAADDTTSRTEAIAAVPPFFAIPIVPEPIRPAGRRLRCAPTSKQPDAWRGLEGVGTH